MVQSQKNSTANEKDQLFVIGDIHGCATELRLLLNRLPLNAQSQVVFLGDLVDRGAESRQVLETVMELAKKVPVICLKGNHEDMMLAFLDDPQSEKAGMFIYNGGSATLASYGQQDGTYSIPEQHVKFLRGLDFFYESEMYFFVHAGVPPDLELTEVREARELRDEEVMEELFWIREPFLKSRKKWEKMIIHGHTPVLEVEKKPNRINMDTGCVYDRKLSALSLPSGKIYSVDKQERMQEVYLRDPGSNRVAVRFKGTVPIQIILNGQYLPMESLDYNEFGVYVRDCREGLKGPQFKLQELVTGEIGSQLHNTAQFQGKVVRVDHNERGIFYAIQMLTPVRVLDE